MAIFLLWFIIIFAAAFEILLLFVLGEYIYATTVRHQYPAVSACVEHRRAIVDEIIKHYPNTKTIVDIGAGHGRLARAMGRISNVHIIAVENIGFSVFVMRVLNHIFDAQNVQVVYADAFEYIKKSPRKYDVGVAYLGPAMNARLGDIANNFRVIITLDAEIPGMRATRIIDISDGKYTYYPHVGKYPHRLFIYEFNKI